MLGSWRYFSLYILIYLINSSNSLVTPFFPSVASERNIDPKFIGFIFSCYPLGGVFFALLLGKMMRKWGRKRILFLGLLTQTVGIILFGILDKIIDSDTFLCLSIFSRLLQGMGYAVCNSLIFSFIPTLFPESIDEKVSYLEMAAGIGLMLGPLMGSLAFMIGGYELPFFVMGIVIITLILPIMRVLPDDLEVKLKKESSLLSVRKIFADRRMLVTYFMIFIPSCGITFLDPTFAEHLRSFGIGPVETGIIFSINTIFYSACLAFFSKFLHWADRAFWITIGGLMTCFSFFFLGPEDFFKLPRELWVVCFGCAIMGFGIALVLGPAMPEFLNLGISIYPNDKEALGDMASGIYSSCWFLGEFVGPLLGGILQENIGFETGASCIAVTGLVYTFIYLTLGESYRSFKKRKISTDEPLIEKKTDCCNKRYLEIQKPNM